MKSPEDKTPNAAESSTPPSRRAGVLSYVPSVVVLTAIAAVGVWGHATGWTAPKFAQLAGTQQAKEKEDWCAEHNVPDSTCIKCHPELVGANTNDWCPEHGVPESKCTICHPEILTTGVAGDWCPEHGLPESSCTICHPEIAVKGEVPKGTGIAAVSLVSTAKVEGQEHDGHDHGAAAPKTATEQDAGGSHAGHDHATDAPKTTAQAGADPHAGHSHAAKSPRTCQTHALRVQFASTDSLRKVGVSLAQVSKRPMADAFVANGEAEYDRRHLAAISSPVSGRVWRVLKGLGQEVKAGDVIALVESPEVASAKGDLLQVMADVELAQKTAARLKTSAEKGFRTQAELLEAEGTAKAAQVRLLAAQQRLANLGLAVSPAAIQEAQGEATVRLLGIPEGLRPALGENAPANLLPLVAPLDGLVIAQQSVAGEAVEEHKPLVTVANVERMWIKINLPSSTAGSVAMGQEAAFTPDGDPARAVRGKIVWIDTAVDEQTRTLRARAEVENPGRALKAGAFGQVRIVTRSASEATVVPAEALHWEGCCHVVFVRLADTIFQTRKVRLGARTDEFVEITNGLLPGEVIASAGSNVLRAEILKSNLGAGCADH